LLLDKQYGDLSLLRIPPDTVQEVLMSSFNLTKEMEAIRHAYETGRIDLDQYRDRIDEAHNEYREALQRARQEDAPDPVEEDEDEYPF
jgi:hypothetical protein